MAQTLTGEGGDDDTVANPMSPDSPFEFSNS